MLGEFGAERQRREAQFAEERQQLEVRAAASASAYLRFPAYSCVLLLPCTGPRLTLDQHFVSPGPCRNPRTVERCSPWPC